MLNMCQILCIQIFDRAEKANMRQEIKCRKLLFQIKMRWSFNFKENYVFIEEEDNPSDKVFTVEEDGIGNLLDSPRD